MPEPQIRLGTRGSALAMAQARWIADRLGGAELVEITTSGDRGKGPGDKSRFTKEIDEALLAGEIDIAVHSAKDVPAELPDGVVIAGVPAREDPSDCYVGPARSLDEIPDGTRIGTSSLRRRAQLLAQRPNLRIEELRGNVDTRLGKIGGEVEGAVLASAGLARLEREGEAAFAFSSDQLTPAPGQGALALEAREEDQRAVEAAASITDPRAEAELRAERAAVVELGASCHTPVGILARHEGTSLITIGFAGLPNGREWLRDALTADPSHPEGAGHALGERMNASGAAELLQRASEPVA